MDKFKQTPEYQAEQKRKAAAQMFNTEYELQKDKELAKEDRTLGDKDPESFERRKMNEQMGSLFVGG